MPFPSKVPELLNKVRDLKLTAAWQKYGGIFGIFPYNQVESRGNGPHRSRGIPCIPGPVNPFPFLQYSLFQIQAVLAGDTARKMSLISPLLLRAMISTAGTLQVYGRQVELLDKSEDRATSFAFGLVPVGFKVWIISVGQIFPRLSRTASSVISDDQAGAIFLPGDQCSTL